MRQYFFKVCSAFCLGLVCALNSYAETVDHILIVGHQKTRTAIIEQEMQLVVGDEISDEALEHSRQAVMDLGLFQKVSIRVDHQEDESVVVVDVKEKKHDWYILPRIERNGEGDITLGINWRESNLNGLNQTSRFTLAHKKFDDAGKDTQHRLSWKFVYPRIVNTQFSTYAFANISQVGLKETRDELTGEYHRKAFTAGLGLGRWFARSGASKGLHIDLGIEFNQFEHEHLNGQADYYDDASFVSFISTLSFNQVQDALFSRSGYSMGFRLQKAREQWGSDRPFFYKQAYYKYYRPLAFREHTNLNFQVQMGSGDHSFFGEPIYELSGDRSLRGYPRETLEGDAYFLVNTEFLTPIFSKKNIRAAVLFDFGNAYNSLSEIKNTDLEYSVGVGLRWKFKQWVGTELRIDYARGLGDLGVSRLYVSSEATF